MNVAGCCSGSATLVVLLHDDSPYAMEVIERALLCALRHLGIPFTVVLACDGSRWAEGLGRHPVLIVPQSGTLAHLSETQGAALATAVAAGTGVVVYEPDMALLPPWLAGAFQVDPLKVQRFEFSQMVSVGNDDYICYRRSMGERLASDRPVAGCRIMGGANKSPLVNELGDPLLFTCDIQSGKAVLFPFSIDWFLQECLGHACGADDVFYRSIVWVARKPFVTWSMPAQGGLLVDDCSGSYDHFGYLDVMQKHGWSAHLALFTDTIDEVAHEDVHKAKRKLRDAWNAGKIDFSFHALRYNDSFCFNHLERRPLTKAELDERFAHWDELERAWGIKHSPWAHPHFGEVGCDAVPYFERRGIRWLTYLLPFDAAWFDVPLKYSPLENLPPYGHGGYYQARLPLETAILGCNCVLDNKNRTSVNYVARTDYLWNHTPFWQEADSPLIEQAAQVLALQIRRGLDAGFYGEGATHEQRIAVLRRSEFDEVLQRADQLLARYRFERVPLTASLEIARKRFEARLESIEVNQAGSMVVCRFSGAAAVGTQLQIHGDVRPSGQPECRRVDACEMSFGIESWEGA